jgi:hypothetical protein
MVTSTSKVGLADWRSTGGQWLAELGNGVKRDAALMSL